jgi:Rieske Fe-S protein
MTTPRICPLKPGSLPRQDVEFQQWLGRRDWIKRFALGTAATLGGGLTTPVMADIVPGSNPANIIQIDLNTYPALLNEYGSVRFNLFGTSVSNGIITVTCAPGPVYYAMSAYCTHAGCIVEAYDHSPGTEAMICYCHGSVFNIQGQILSEASQGQPSLPAYNTSLSGSILSVQIPNLNLKVNAITPSTPVSGNARFQIAFPVKQGGKYRVLYTPDLTTAPVQVNFSNTAGGSLSVSQFNSGANSTKSVWVQNNAARGFYMVEMIYAEYVP